jgi:hypothetical protein
MAGGFSCTLEVFQGGLKSRDIYRILAIFDIKKYQVPYRFYFSCKILQLLVINSLNLIRIRIDLKFWIRIRIDTHADPQIPLKIIPDPDPDRTGPQNSNSQGGNMTIL